MRKSKFYITCYDSEDKNNRKQIVKEVDGYVGEIFTSTNECIKIGVYKSDEYYVAHELSTGMKFAYGVSELDCLKNTMNNADVIYNVINDDTVLVVKCKEFIGNKNDGR